ncbi:nuclear transport factor 2 family protein [Natronobacterium texcoconense]|uniref:SnoaL-like domain-containing protein n=1 Tax=Natronobacterium texcoconense TaxID=1095778 RepID=A0A1H1GUI8_NATTX|nr:nuclear transport factor 2 family protein [Natronobacterium texcoconense]SDR16882.1 SnoaL-like domain-containing protein [Natronobacterium texcoconense]
MSEAAETVVREYYETLRRNDPLEPYFLEDESTVKFGISESAFGYDEVETALRSQQETTREWTVESENLQVSEHESFATFADEVRMAWTTDGGDEKSFDTRWSGTLVPAENDEMPAWLFASMHVSTAHEI